MTGGEGTGFTGTTEEKGRRICDFTEEVGDDTQKSLDASLKRFNLDRFGYDWEAAATIYRLGVATPASASGGTTPARI